jgi:Methyltransferase domain
VSAASSRPRSCGTAEHRLFAALYDRMTGPLERAVLGERRAGLLADLTGEVLDVGAGTGANLPYIRSASRVVAAEPDPAMRRRLAAKLAAAPVPVELTGDAAEALHQPDASFDAGRNCSTRSRAGSRPGRCCRPSPHLRPEIPSACGPSGGGVMPRRSAAVPAIVAIGVLEVERPGGAGKRFRAVPSQVQAADERMCPPRGRLQAGAGRVTSVDGNGCMASSCHSPRASSTTASPDLLRAAIQPARQPTLVNAYCAGQRGSGASGAVRYHGDVAGMVLINLSHEDQARRLQQDEWWCLGEMRTIV